MKDKLNEFALDHPFLTAVFISILLTPIVMAFGAMLTTCIIPDRSSNLDDVKDAQYVIYTSEGEMKAVEYSTVVDMDTGYQYRIFESTAYLRLTDNTSVLLRLVRTAQSIRRLNRRDIYGAIVCCKFLIQHG